MNIESYVRLCEHYGEEMASLLEDICDGADPEDYRAMLKQAESLTEEWREFRETAEVER